MKLHSFLLASFSLLSLSAAELTIQINHRHGGKPVLLDSLRYQTTALETFSVTRLSYLLTDFSLEKEDGSLVHLKGQAAWVDHPRRVLFTLKNVPEADYRALRFYLGPNKKDNHADPSKLGMGHPLSPTLNKLHWDWQGGYIFLALEGRYRKGAEIPGYVFHLANDKNRISLNLTHKIPIRNHTELQLDFHLDALLNAPQPFSFAKYGNTSHSNSSDPIPELLSTNILQVFQMRSVTAFAAKKIPIKKTKPLYLPASFTPYRFTIPSGIPIPPLPRDNPLTNERVALGQVLFNDTRLSRDGSISCASCHQIGTAFSDPRRFSVGVGGKEGTRNAMPLFNLAWKPSFFWDGRATSLREQVLVPIADPVEMHQDLKTLPAKLASDRRYADYFQKAFGSPEITTEKIALALEAHLLTITSFDSKFDRAMKGKAELTEQEKRGFKLFFTEFEPRAGKRGGDCFHCHGGPLFTDNAFHDVGLADTHDTGLHRITQKDSDRGKFMTPSLRNIALTAPYMHDGRFGNLEEVMEHYDRHKQRTPNLDPNLAKHPRTGMELSDEDKAALIAYLKTLTDLKYQKN